MENFELAQELIAAVKALQVKARSVRTGLSSDIAIFQDFANQLDNVLHDSSIGSIEEQEAYRGEDYDSDEARMKCHTRALAYEMHRMNGSAV